MWLIVLLMSPSLQADPQPAPTEEAARAELRSLPDYASRREAAELRVAGGQGWFSGERRFEQAWPALAGGEPFRLSWIALQLAALDDAALARELEAREALPQGLTGRGSQRWIEARSAALDAEAQADALERRMLLLARDLLRQQPQLEHGPMGPLREDLEARRSALEAGWDPQSPDGLAAMAALDAQARALDTVRFEVLRAFSVEGVSLDLSALRAQVQAGSMDAALLMARVLPLASEADAAALGEWLAARTPWTSAGEGLDELHHERRLLPQGAHPMLVAWTGWLDQEELRLQAQLQEQLEAEEEQVELADFELEELPEDPGQAHSDELEAIKRAYKEAKQASDDAKVAADQAEETYRAGNGLPPPDQQLGVEALSERLTALQARTQKLPEPGVIGTGRDEQLDAIYGDLRTLIRDLRREALHAGRAKDSAEKRAARLEVRADADWKALEVDLAWVHGVDDPDVRRQARRPMENQRKAILNLRRIASLERRHAQEYQKEVVELLHDAKELRRVLRPDAGTAELAEDTRNLGGDAVLEARLVVPSLVAQTVDRVAGLRSFRDKALDFTFWRMWLRRVLVLVVGLGGWSALRKQVLPMTQQVTRRLEARRGRFRTQGLQQLVEPLAGALRAGIDVALSYALLGPAREVLPEAGLALLVWAQVLLFRFILRTYELAVAPGATQRPALLRMTQPGWELGLRTVRALALWVILRQFLGYVLLDLLAADALHEIVRTVLLVALVAVSVRLLHAWEPVLRALVALQGGDDPVRRFLAAEPKNPRVTRWLRALLDLLLLTASALWNVLQARAGERSALGRLLNLFYRYSMGEREEESSPTTALSAEQRALLTHPELPDAACFVERPELEEAFWKAFNRWDKERRQGSLALVGDRGSGRRTWTHELCRALADKGWGVKRVRLDQRVVDEASLMRLISAQLELDPCDTVEALEAALVDRPAAVIVVEGLDQAFLRKVGGFEAMRAFLELVGQAGERHFWLLGVHLPAWAYLSRLQSLLKVHLIHHVYEVPPFSEAELRELVLRRMTVAGLEPEFTRLVRGGALAGDADSERERAVSAFFRVLGEAANGNPEVALQLWCECVQLVEPGRAEVRLGQALQETRIDGLSQPDLFTLAALRMHDGLTEAQLAVVNNMASSQVRSSLQVLRGRNLVARTQDIWSVPARRRASVTRTLWHRNFLDWRQA